jgi:hypothetical protein
VSVVWNADEPDVSTARKGLSNPVREYLDQAIEPLSSGSPHTQDLKPSPVHSSSSSVVAENQHRLASNAVEICNAVSRVF